MPKRNVYLDDDLDAEVRNLGISLSPVCQTALRHEVEVQRRLAQVPARTRAAAERLIEARAEENAKQHQDGVTVGTEWAEKKASWWELRHFERSTRGRLPDLIPLPEEHSLRWAIFNHFYQQGAEVEPQDFDRLNDDNAFDRGVIEGAAAVLAAVRPLVEGSSQEHLD
jgi:post-segregation antitoxin (ccd killing protein)